MMTLLIRMLIQDDPSLVSPDARRRCAALCGALCIALNLLLCAVKLAVGLLSRSVSVLADGMNNLSDAAVSLAMLAALRIARYTGGRMHPFGHGRIEWITGIFGALLVVLVGLRLAESSVQAIVHPQMAPLSLPMALALLLSIAVKLYMFAFSRRYAHLADAQTLRAAAADSLSDALATGAVLLCALFSGFTGIAMDGVCGLLVSLWIVFSGAVSLSDTLGRIMGRAPDRALLEDIDRLARAQAPIVSVRDVMLHDYGFGRRMLCMHAEGYREDAQALYAAIHALALSLESAWHSPCCIQCDYLLQDGALHTALRDAIVRALSPYGASVGIADFRLLEGGALPIARMDLLYPAGLQSRAAQMEADIRAVLSEVCPSCSAQIRHVLRRERLFKKAHNGQEGTL